MCIRYKNFLEKRNVYYLKFVYLFVFQIFLQEKNVLFKGKQNYFNIKIIDIQYDELKLLFLFFILK